MGRITDGNEIEHLLGDDLGDSLAQPFADPTKALRVVTFYSWKGGVGRTMALANVAYRMAQRHGKRVLAVDWDLEAPGLHRFFGYSDEAIADKPGVLDFFMDWQTGIRKKTSPPPDARPWILAVDAEPLKPAFGSLSFLPAGKQNAEYGRRLSSFDWRAFYKSDNGADAVERFRRQLVDSADIVLIDSRTGLTDIGGICTVQLPDGVVLMTAPNEQSLAGIKQVARAIHDPNTKRAGRTPPTTWLAVCRVPILEEQGLTQTWFDEHANWFDKGKEAGLWSAMEHPRGLRSYVLPQRARWAFGEQIIHARANFNLDDPLVEAFDKLAQTIALGNSERGLLLTEATKSDAEGAQTKFDQLQRDVAAAEQRGDTNGLAIALVALGGFLAANGRATDALAPLEKALGIFIGLRDEVGQGGAYGLIGSAYLKMGKPHIAVASLNSAISYFSRHDVTTAAKGSELMVHTFVLLVEAYEATGNTTQADESASKAATLLETKGKQLELANFLAQRFLQLSRRPTKTNAFVPLLRSMRIYAFLGHAKYVADVLVALTRNGLQNGTTVADSVQRLLGLISSLPELRSKEHVQPAWQYLYGQANLAERQELEKLWPADLGEMPRPTDTDDVLMNS
jgi:MinD-like ATPase involved in chromosome partitioning or flagellar assembly/tetratricopeptide (TPR) repeat protein